MAYVVLIILLIKIAVSLLIDAWRGQALDRQIRIHGFSLLFLGGYTWIWPDLIGIHIALMEMPIRLICLGGIMWIGGAGMQSYLSLKHHLKATRGEETMLRALLSDVGRIGSSLILAFLFGVAFFGQFQRWEMGLLGILLNLFFQDLWNIFHNRRRNKEKETHARDIRELNSLLKDWRDGSRTLLGLTLEEAAIAIAVLTKPTAVEMAGAINLLRKVPDGILHIYSEKH